MIDFNQIKTQIMMLKKVAEMMPPQERKEFAAFLLAMANEILKMD